MVLINNKQPIYLFLILDVNNESIIQTLRLIYPKMEHNTNLIKKLKLAKGLKVKHFLKVKIYIY